MVSLQSILDNLCGKWGDPGAWWSGSKTRKSKMKGRVSMIVPSIATFVLTIAVGVTSCKDAQHDRDASSEAVPAYIRKRILLPRLCH